MRNLESILKSYESCIECWIDDFGEGHLFLDDREQLIIFENDERIRHLDKKALDVIKKDNSQGSDKFFLKEIENIIHNASYNKKVA